MYRLKLLGWTEKKPDGATWKDFLLSKPPKTFETAQEGRDWIEANLQKTSGPCPILGVVRIPQSLVWQYGLTHMRTWRDERVDQQILLGHRYQNELIAVELRRRERRAEVELGFLDPALEPRRVELEEQIEALRDQAKKLNKAARGNVVDKKALTTAMKPLKAELKEVRQAIRDARKAIRESEEAQALFATIDSDAHADLLRYREDYSKNQGLYWGTYLLSEAAVQAASKKPTLRFRRWTGEGSIGVQIQGGMSVEELLSCEDTRAQVVPPDPAAWDESTPKSARRRLCRTKMRLRIGSDGREPIWAEFPVAMHRPFPDGATIKAIRVHRRLNANKMEWNVDFTLNVEPSPVRVGATAAIDLGWRRVHEGLRVATLSDEDGAVKDLIMPDRIIDAFRNADSIKSIRDKAFEAFKLQFRGLLPETVPEWFAERTETFSSWRSRRRVYGLFAHWRGFRFKGDEAAFACCETWYHQDKHLDQWAVRKLRKTCRERKNLYRNWAAEIGDRYGRVILEKMDLREFAKLPEVEDEKAVQAREYRSMAAVSELRQAIRNAVMMRGGTVEEVDPAYTTVACHNCGTIDSWDPAKEVSHRCSGCGETWHQDVNAAKNMLLAASGAAP